MRVRATISYDGSKFFGFQPLNEKGRPTRITVVQTIETLLKALKIDSKVTGAGRTDKDVHASGQVISFDLPPYWGDLHKLQRILNQKLDHIQFRSLEPTNDDFNPRFDAKTRTYRYIISTGHKSPFLTPYVTFLEKLDAGKIKEAITLFEGEHDFELFHKTGSDTNSTIRTVYKTHFYKRGDYYIFTFKGNAFLRSQIRMMVGSLIKLSEGKMDALQLQEQLDKINAHNRWPAPPNGLYLAKITY